MGIELAVLSVLILGLLALGFPIAIVLGGVGVGFLVLIDPNQLVGAAYTFWNTTSSEVLISIPLFILMGEVLQRTDLASRFYDAMAIWVQRIPGRLLHANVLACGFFAAVSGSSVATAATIGTAAVPNLLQRKYPKSLVLGTLSAGGTLGILIPPSVPLIIYGALVEDSVGQLFLAGFVPGMILMGMFMIYTAAAAMINRSSSALHEEYVPITLKLALASLRSMIPLVIIIASIIGGLYTGWTTPTEAAALGVAISMIVAALNGKLTWRVIWEALGGAVEFTSMLMLIILGASILSYAMFVSGLGGEIASWIVSLPLPRAGIFLVIIIVYFVLGMFIDTISIMVMTIGIIHPIIISLGYDSIWFGIMLVILLEIGLITPPVGMNLYTLKAVDPDNIRLEDVAVASIPFVILMLLGIGIFMLWPQLVLWLPQHMM